jgi:hypothetical protein
MMASLCYRRVTNKDKDSGLTRFRAWPVMCLIREHSDTCPPESLGPKAKINLQHFKQYMSQLLSVLSLKTEMKNASQKREL